MSAKEKCYKVKVFCLNRFTKDASFIIASSFYFLIYPEHNPNLTDTLKKFYILQFMKIVNTFL
jgi:hypothetical protein